MPSGRTVIPLHRRGTTSAPVSEWAGGVLPLPAPVGPAAVRPDIVLWIELPHCAVVGYELLDRGTPPAQVAAVLRRAIEQPMVGPPRRPERVRLASTAAAAAVRLAFGTTLEIVVAPTPELDDVLKSFAEFGEKNPPPVDGASPLHRLDRRLVERLMHYARGRFGERWLQARDAFADPDRTIQLFLPWSVYHFPVDGRPVADWLLADPSQTVTAEERAWLDAQRGAWLSVWEVREVSPGSGLTLEDLLSGETRRVVEASGSRQAVPGDTLLGRVVDHAGISVLGGIHPHILPPLLAAEVVEAARRRLRRRTNVPIERLRGGAVERHLIASWEREVALMVEQAGRKPELRNTDGDELLFTVDHFAVAAGRRAEVEARLATLDDLEGPPWAFVRRDKTLLGHVELDHAGLRLETNSIARADRLRARLEEACGGLLTHRAREHSSPFAPPDPSRPRAKVPRSQVIPKEEEDRIVREMLDRHYADWPDHPLPALSGQTPRQAVRTADGRKLVRTLIKSIEHNAARGPLGQAPDTARLRSELGLADQAQ